MEWFWQAVLLLMFVVPMFTAFVYAFWDVIRRGETGVLHKMLWLIAFCVVPIVGPLLYLAIRPPGTTAQERALAAGGSSRTDELMSLADLHDRGKLTDEEFENAKAPYAGAVTTVREQRLSGA